MEEKNIAWHAKPLYLILLIIFVFPVGAYFLYKNWKDLSKTIKYAGVILLILIVGAVSQNGETSSSSKSNLHRDITWKTDCSYCNKKFEGMGYMYAFNRATKVTNGQGMYCSMKCAKESH